MKLSILQYFKNLSQLPFANASFMTIHVTAKATTIIFVQDVVFLENTRFIQYPFAILEYSRNPTIFNNSV